MKLLASKLAATAFALSQDISFNSQLHNAENLKNDHFNAQSIFIIDRIRSGIINGEVTGPAIETLEKVCDKCSDYEPRLGDIQNMLVFPDLTSPQGGFSQIKLDIYMSNICGAVNCRDKVGYCANIIADREMSCETEWMQSNCANSCGCRERQCPPLITPEVIEAVIEEDAEDAEHSDEIIDLSIEEAIKLLDPTSILGQFDSDVRVTLQSQMCTVPNADSRIVAANDLLRVLVDPETARLMNHINEKLPMYLQFLPEATKTLIAENVICNGYQRTVSEESCLGHPLLEEHLACEARMPRWTFDKVTGTCIKSVYDGCFMTENRFLSKESCENKCQYHIKAAIKVNERKLENFMSTLTPENLRDGLLGMFGKQQNAVESTNELLYEACDPINGKVSPLYMERLCPRLQELYESSQNSTEEPSSVLKPPRTEGNNPVVIVEEICPAKASEKKFCTKRPPGRGWQKACEEAGCCFDPKPVSKANLLWKDFCFHKIEKRTIVTVPMKQLAKDDEHSAAAVEQDKCAVDIQNREFCTIKPKTANFSKLKSACEEAGCCFESRSINGKSALYPKWRNSCYKGN